MIVVTESSVWNWEHGRAHLMKKAWELRFEAPQKKLKQGGSGGRHEWLRHRVTSCFLHCPPY